MSFNFSSQASEGEAKSRRDFNGNLINPFSLVPTHIEGTVQAEPATPQQGGGGSHSSFSLSSYSSAGLPSSDEVPLPDSVLEETEYHLTPLASLPPPTPLPSASASAPPLDRRPWPSELAPQLPAQPLSMNFPAMTLGASPLIPTVKPFDLGNLITIQDFINIKRNIPSDIQYRNYLNSQAEDVLLSILKKIHQIIHKNSDTIDNYRNPSAFSEFEVLISILLTKMNGINLCFSKEEKYNVIFFSLSCWGFPLTDEIIINLVNVLTFSGGNKFEIINPLISSFTNYNLDAKKNNSISSIKYGLQQLTLSIEVLCSNFLGSLAANSFYKKNQIDIRNLIKLYEKYQIDVKQLIKVYEKKTVESWKWDASVIKTQFKELFRILLKNELILPEFKERVQNLLGSIPSPSPLPPSLPLPTAPPSSTPSLSTSSRELTSLSVPPSPQVPRAWPLTVDLKRLYTINYFIQLKDSLRSQSEVVLFEILKKVHGIVHAKNLIFNVNENVNGGTVFYNLIDLIINKNNFDKFNSTDKYEILFLSLSCWSFPLFDTYISKIVHSCRALFPIYISLTALINRLINSFVNYTSDQAKNSTFSDIEFRLERLIKTINSFIIICGNSILKDSITQELSREPIFIRDLIKLYTSGPPVHTKESFHSKEKDSKNLKESFHRLFNILLENGFILPEFKEQVQLLIASPSSSPYLSLPLPQSPAPIASLSSTLSSSSEQPPLPPPPQLKSRAEVSSWDDEYLDHTISENELVSRLSSREFGILQENYQVLANQIEQKWTQGHIQPILGHLLKCSKGKRIFNLMHDSIEDHILQQILEPFVAFRDNHMLLASKKKMSPKYLLHLFLLRDAISSCGLQIPNDLDERALRKFEAKLIKIFELCKENVQGLLQLLQTNSWQIPKVSPIELCPEKEESYKIGIYNALFVLTLKQLHTRSRHLKSVLLQEKISTKVTPGGFVYYHDEKIELYPIRLELDPATCNVLAVGLDGEHSVSQMMHSKIPALKKCSPQADGFSLNFEESEQILDFYKNPTFR